MSARPFLRPLVVWVLAVPALALAVLACFLLAPFLGGPGAFWAVAPRYIRGVARAFGIRRALIGWEHLPADIRDGHQAVILVGNHASLFDPPLLISTLPCRPVFIAKKELARVPFLGWVIWLARFIFIDRGDPQAARESLGRAARRIRGGQSVMTFPEGTRSPDGRLLPFKKGTFHLALEAGVPILPLAISGGRTILPKGTWRVRGGAYRITLGIPVWAADHGDAEALRDAVARAMASLVASSPP